MGVSSTLSRAWLRHPGVMAIDERASGFTQHRESSRIRVMVANSHEIFGHGVRALLENAPDIEVVAEAADGKEALAKARISLPDVMVADVRIWRSGVIDLATALRSEGLDTRLIILSSCTQVEMVVAAVKLGAYGYLCDSLSGPDLVNGIRAVHAGDTVLSPAIAGQFAREISEHQRAKLTPRERDVLLLVAKGLRNKEIARHLGISEGTAKLHVAHIFGKLEVNGRTEAMGKALQLGIIASP